MLRSLILEREQQKQRVEEENKRANDLQKRADELHLENLRLQLQLDRYKRWYYGPRADRLSSSGDVAQILLEFAEKLNAKPIHPEDVPMQAAPEYELRRGKGGPGRRQLATLEKLPLPNPGYGMRAQERNFSCCGRGGEEVGAKEEWRMEEKTR